MDRYRAAWNSRQQQLQQALSRPVEHPQCIALFLSQHAQVHSKMISSVDQWSFEDEVLDGLDDRTLRAVPPKSEHSIAWILWHLARCEDVTMNMLVGGTDQVFDREEWQSRIGASLYDTGNGLDSQQVVQFGDAVHLDNLKAYRQAVGQSTRLIISRLNPSELKVKVDAERMLKVRQSGVVIAAASGILDYWGSRTIAGLLLMPPTRHCFTHLNEALRIRRALHK